MVIKWKDVNLEEHTIDLKDAIDVKINGIKIVAKSQGSTIRVQTNGRMGLYLNSGNSAEISDIEV